MVITDFKLRYQGSVLGYAWSLLKPLVMFVILYVVFGLVLRLHDSIPHYPVYLLLGLLLWNYFTEVTSTGVRAIVENGELIRKLSFPRYTLVLAGSVSAFINLGISLLVFAGFLIATGVDMRWDALWFPLLLIELFMLSIGVAFGLSALFVKFRDVSYIWELVLQAAFYCTPIIYLTSFVREVSEPLARIQMLFPMTQVIQDARFALVTADTETVGQVFGSAWFRLIPLAVAFGLLLLAAWYFRRAAPSFAEEV